MNARKWLFVVFVVVAFFVPFQARADFDYLYFSPSTQVTATPGSTVGVDVYLHSGEAQGLDAWSITLGIDSTELTYQSVTYYSTLLTGHNGTTAYNSATHQITNINAAQPLGNLTEEQLTAGENLKLFTAYFTFNGGVWDGTDVWGIFSNVTDTVVFNLADKYYDSDNPITIQGTGPDYAAVPVPAAAYLLGSGLIGLIGLRRRKA